MKCFNHLDKDAVATCSECGKGLCKECAIKYNQILCDECYEKLNNKQIENISQKKMDALIDTWSEFLKAVGIGIISVIIASLIFKIIIRDKSFFWVVSSGGIAFFFLPFGWSFFTWLEGKMMLSLGILASLDTILIFTIIKLSIKLFLSVIIGIVLFVYQIIKFEIKLIKHSNDKKKATLVGVISALILILFFIIFLI